MIIQFMMAPGATLMTLPRAVALTILGLSGLTAGAVIGGSGVQAGRIGPAEICTLCIAGSLATAAVVFQIFVNLGNRLEDNFDARPWKSSEQPSYECPYTGLLPGHRCPVCEAYVHETAFHSQDKLTTFVVGESVLDWPKAYKALEQVDPAQGRNLLDEGLDFRGNYYFGCVGSCCLGCAAWKQCFLVLPQWAMILAAMALAGGLVPWAFAGSLSAVQYGGRLQAVAEVYAIFFGVSSLAVMLHACSSAIIFMDQHGSKIAFPSPIALPAEPHLRKAVRLLAGAPEPSLWDD